MGVRLITRLRAQSDTIQNLVVLGTLGLSVLIVALVIGVLT